MENLMLKRRIELPGQAETKHSLTGLVILQGPRGRNLRIARWCTARRAVNSRWSHTDVVYARRASLGLD